MPLLREGLASSERSKFCLHKDFGNQSGSPVAEIRCGDRTLIGRFEDGWAKL